MGAGPCSYVSGVLGVEVNVILGLVGGVVGPTELVLFRVIRVYQIVEGVTRFYNQFVVQAYPYLGISWVRGKGVGGRDHRLGRGSCRWRH